MNDADADGDNEGSRQMEMDAIMRVWGCTENWKDRIEMEDSAGSVELSQSKESKRVEVRVRHSHGRR